jgi:hypothetical protein
VYLAGSCLFYIYLCILSTYALLKYIYFLSLDLDNFQIYCHLNFSIILSHFYLILKGVSRFLFCHWPKLTVKLYEEIVKKKKKVLLGVSFATRVLPFFNYVAPEVLFVPPFSFRKIRKYFIAAISLFLPVLFPRKIGK